MLAVVEDEQQSLRGDVLDEPGHRPTAQFVAEPEGGDHRLGDELGILQATELHQPDAIRNAAPEVGRRSERQARLTDTARSDKGHQAGGGQGRLDVLDLAPVAR